MSGRVLDLFSGAGGFTLGFENAGYDVIAGVDNDVDAIKTYEANFDHEAIHENLAGISPADFADCHDIHPDDVDVVIGGPPCQGFSESNTNRHVDDERNNLVFVFAEYVDYYRPDAFVMENVKGIRNVDDGSLFDRLLETFEASGYTVDWEVLNAADYGVPQARERVFVQGQVDGGPEWPEPTHAPAEELCGST